MGARQYPTEQIIVKLREAEIELGRGMEVPKRQPKRRRLWLHDGSSIRRRAEGPNHAWSYDFVQDWTTDGRGSD